jgi:hypothetical protein
LPITYQQIGLAFYAVCALVAMAAVWGRGRRPMGLAAAMMAAGLFVVFTGMHERYLFPALAFSLLAAARGETPTGDVRGGWVSWAAYGLFSATLLFNLVTIASPAPGLWGDLTREQTSGGLVAVLRVLSLVVAAANVAGLVALLVLLGRYATDRVDRGGRG